MIPAEAAQRPPPSEPARSLTVALVGNPNTGKTTLFNALAGMRQRVGNYPGVTVESKKGTLRFQGRSFQLVDLPGTYSLAARSPDEMVAVDLLLGQQQGEDRPDVVVTIVDASNLERNLYLTTQVLELGVPVVVALNMIDVARAQGITIDAERLTRQLGVPVIPIQANRRKGLEQLKQAIVAAAGKSASTRAPVFPETFEGEVEELRRAVGEEVPLFLLRRLLVDVNGHTEKRLVEHLGPALPAQLQAARQRLAAAGCGVPGVEARARYAWIRQATAGCVTRPEKRPVTWTDRLDRVLTHRVWGTLIFLAVMFLVFQSLFAWAKPLMDWIGQGQDHLGALVEKIIPEPGAFRSLLNDGILKGVGSVLVFLPQIVILFGFIAILEDCGYMARAAFLMDKLMARCGLSGKSFIPLLSSVACAVPGIMAARVIENRRDRWATMLVAPLMSCSARLPVYLLLIDAFLTAGFAWWVPGVTLFAMYLIGIVVAPLVALLLKRTLLRGETPLFVMEMPVYKWPSSRTILHRMTGSGSAFLRRAGTMILASMIVVWALLYFPNGPAYEKQIAALNDKINNQNRAELETEMNRLQGEWSRQSFLGQMGRAIEPVVRPLGWDWRIGMAALASFPAREVVVGTLGVIYSQGRGEAGDLRYRKELGERLQEEWNTNAVPVALSVMVFFALCCQCVSTLAVIKRETNSWRWPVFTFVYMTVLAYIGALVTFQLGRLLI